jgi:hypothetical protein
VYLVGNCKHLFCFRTEISAKESQNFITWHRFEFLASMGRLQELLEVCKVRLLRVRGIEFSKKAKKKKKFSSSLI